MDQELTKIYTQLETPEFWEDAWKLAREKLLSTRRRKGLRESVSYWNQRKI